MEDKGTLSGARVCYITCYYGTQKHYSWEIPLIVFTRQLCVLQSPPTRVHCLNDNESSTFLSCDVMRDASEHSVSTDKNPAPIEREEVFFGVRATIWRVKHSSSLAHYVHLLFLFLESVVHELK